MKHTGGTIRRTDDGFDPLEVDGDGKKFARPKIQEILFFLRCLVEELQRISGQKLKDVITLCIH